MESIFLIPLTKFQKSKQIFALYRKEWDSNEKYEI